MLYSPTSTFNFIIFFRGLYSRIPLKEEGRGERKGKEGKGQERGAPQFTFLATPLMQRHWSILPSRSSAFALFTSLAMVGLV